MPHPDDKPLVSDFTETDLDKLYSGVSVNDSERTTEDEPEKSHEAEEETTPPEHFEDKSGEREEEDTDEPTPTQPRLNEDIRKAKKEAKEAKSQLQALTAKMASKEGYKQYVAWAKDQGFTESEIASKPTAAEIDELDSDQLYERMVDEAATRAEARAEQAVEKRLKHDAYERQRESTHNYLTETYPSYDRDTHGGRIERLMATGEMDEDQAFAIINPEGAKEQTAHAERERTSETTRPPRGTKSASRQRPKKKKESKLDALMRGGADNIDEIFGSVSLSTVDRTAKDYLDTFE